MPVSDLAFNDLSVRVLSELKYLREGLESLKEDTEDRYGQLQHGITQRLDHIERKIQATTNTLTGNNGRCRSPGPIGTKRRA